MSFSLVLTPSTAMTQDDEFSPLAGAGIGLHESMGPTAAVSPGTMIGLAVYWWGVAVFWFVMLIVLLPSQIQKLVGDHRKGEVLGIICLFSALFSVGLAPVFGLLSDNCTHRWGRRRPFLVMGTCGVVCSLFGMILSKDIYFFGGFYVIMQAQFHLPAVTA